MSSTQDVQPSGTVKGKKATPTNPPPPPRPAGPTTFFLRSEQEVEKGIPRGRKSSREEDMVQKTPMGSAIGDSAFGVQSLVDTIASSSAFSSDGAELSRTTSCTSEASMEVNAGAENVMAGRKRKAGNPVHPKILATGQRILSAEYAPASLHTAESSPLRRRGSVASSVNLSQPLTPLKMSPRPQSAMPSTPRSGSPKSFRLSDEEASIASDTGSQAIQSSSGEENEDEESLAGADKKVESPMPQLVMPSIAMPARRPFTDRGRRMGRLKVMVIGAKGVGKTSLIQSLCHVCEDVVHLDSVSNDGRDKSPPCRVTEIGASTRPFPSWWTDFESRRMLLRRKSVGSDGVLERNLTFIDTAGFGLNENVQPVLQHFKSSLSRVAIMERMHDSELVSLLSGDGGVQIDAVLYLFDPNVVQDESDPRTWMGEEGAELLQYLCKWTNVIPLIGHADTMLPDALAATKKRVLHAFQSLDAEPCRLNDIDSSDDGSAPVEPYALSCIPTPSDELEGMDASLLMSSGYIQPLLPSELPTFAKRLLEPDNIARLRHISAVKFLLWRQVHLGAHIDLQKQLVLKSPRFNCSSGMRSASSVPDEASKVLVPHASSSHFRSVSPSASDSSALSGNATTNALAVNNPPDLPFRQVRLAKWAQDLQRSLHNESRRYHQRIFARSPSPFDAESVGLALTNTSTNAQRPAKGRLGGELGIIDPRDPLGLLTFSQAFRRRGWFVMRVAARVGLIWAVVWAAERHWVELQEWLGFGEPTVAVVSITALPAPATATETGFAGFWRSAGEFFGWGG